MTVLFDTCALISLLNEKAICHVSAEQCLRKLVEGKHRIVVSPFIGTRVSFLRKTQNCACQDRCMVVQGRRRAGWKELRAWVR